MTSSAARWILSPVLSFVLLSAQNAAAKDPSARSVLHIVTDASQLGTFLPPSTHLMLEPQSIERLLDQLDGHPPDWQTVYGQGHHDPGHDERLFALNRERDARREGNSALSWLVTFAWTGELSPFDPQLGGFPVALGPKFISTSWGIVRFKAEDPPGNLVVLTDEPSVESRDAKSRQPLPQSIDVLMTGRLLPDESLVYDFSHEQEGVGLIIPFVRVEQIHFVLMK
jgi:hypothetical protein